MTNRKVIGIVLISFVISVTKLLAFDNDSTIIKTKPIKLPKHYFSNTFYVDYYAPNERKFDTLNPVYKKLKSYQISQFSMGFNLPVITKDFYNKDSTKISNLHFLVTGGYTALNLKFGGISEHTLSKTYLGFRGLYNNGKKSIFFVEVAPFITQDNGYSYTRILRLSTTLLYNCALSDRFSFRVGFTRSFLYGNLLNLPYIGIRVGRLDKTNFSLQFPRSISLNIPIGKYVHTSLYAKPQGGFYTFANKDTIGYGNIYDDKTLYFGRSEFLLGTRVDILPTKHFNFYLSGGLTTHNNVQFFPTTKSPYIIYSYNEYYQQKVKGGLFVNFGIVVKFGKTKSIYNNQQMYNAVDMNNSSDSGDNNVNHTNSELSNPKQKMGKNKTDDVLDLIDAGDLY